jgi:hypothetical protein
MLPLPLGQKINCGHFIRKTLFRSKNKEILGVVSANMLSFAILSNLVKI